MVRHRSDRRPTFTGGDSRFCLPLLQFKRRLENMLLYVHTESDASERFGTTESDPEQHVPKQHNRQKCATGEVPPSANQERESSKKKLERHESTTCQFSQPRELEGVALRLTREMQPQCCGTAHPLRIPGKRPTENGKHARPEEATEKMNGWRGQS